jgi:hypothetical protein
MSWQDDIYNDVISRRAKAEPVSRRAAGGSLHSGAGEVIRQSRREPNKTERRFEIEYLKPWLATGEIDEIGEHESITLRLANGLRYSPDYPTWKAGKLTFYEVKGAYVYEDAIKSLKIAANKYRHCRFFIYKYVKGVWVWQEVLA